ncbi:MAG: FtsX-like permease family protein [Burkholderiales bacterium]
MNTIWLDLSLGYRNIVRQRRRSAVAIGAISFGITALIVASGFIEWILMDFRESTINGQLGHIQIVKPGYYDSGKADPYAFLLPNETPLLGETENAGAIKVVAPRLSFSGLISHGDATLSFIGEGVDPLAEAAFGNGLQISSGSNLKADDRKSVIVGEGLARNLGITVGDTVVLLANTATGGTNAVELSVRGLFSTVTKAYDDAALRIPIDTARTLLRSKGSHVWIVLLNKTADTDRVLANLRARLGNQGVEIVPWYELANFYNKTAQLFTRQVQAIKLIIAIIILLSISNTMTMTVIERIGEIGTAMALGVRRTGILRLFLSEGLLLGCIGGVVGVLAGVGLAAVISSIGIPMPAPPGMAHGYTGAVLVTPQSAIEALVLAIAITLIASIFPAWKASRQSIVDALRFNR